MGRTRTFPLYDRILNGQLASTLHAWKAEGLSIEEITWRLREEHDIRVSIATVHRWFAQIADDAEDQAS